MTGNLRSDSESVPNICHWVFTRYTNSFTLRISQINLLKIRKNLIFQHTDLCIKNFSPKSKSFGRLDISCYAENNCNIIEDFVPIHLLKMRWAVRAWVRACVCMHSGFFCTADKPCLGILVSYSSLRWQYCRRAQPSQGRHEQTRIAWWIIIAGRCFSP